MFGKIKTYLLVTKPGIILGNLISASGGFLLASRGRIDVVLFLSTLIGLSLVIASGCIFNNIIDRNLDRRMTRTKGRVLVTGRLSPQAALCYGTTLGIAGMALLAATTNRLCVSTVLAGFIVYVVVYSLVLKPRSGYSTLIGSLAGTAPPLAGYVAVTNGFDMGAIVLLFIFGLWQMPHCYAIAIFRFSDYKSANIPILPVRQGIATTRNHMIIFMLAFTVAAMMLTFCGYTGYRYLGVTVVICLFWLYTAWIGHKKGNDRTWSRQLFINSILTITLLCIMMSIDFTVPFAGDMLLACKP
ncbi:MAG: heme o synthase [Deltaproteobacteria bacterium]|nr:heme o synthase [Deltaproteobacteria bacterium]